MSNHQNDASLQECLGDCAMHLSQKLSNLEARFKGPLSAQSERLHPPPPKRPQSLQSACAGKMQDPPTPSSFKFSSSQAKSATSVSTSAVFSPSSLLDYPFPVEFKKRRRPSEMDEGGNNEEQNKQPKGSPVFSGASEPLACEDSNSCISNANDSQFLEVFTGLLNSAENSDFFKSEIVASFVKQIKDLKRTIDRTQAALAEKERVVLLAERHSQRIRNELASKEEELAQTKEVAGGLEESSGKGKRALIRALRELEEKKRDELKHKLFNDSFRLGRVIMMRNGTSFAEYWEDGKEILETQQQSRSLAAQKEALDKQKRQLKKLENTELAQTLPLKLSLLSREETSVKEKLDKLEIEKNLHIQESKRITEEDNAKYSKSTPDHEAWPMLHGRYLLLSLLGKGGYSEVYKGYDLREHTYLAVKFHQLNSNWPELVKNNYIRHALRENQIYKELSHARIVRHFDTKEVDSNCFCTILEYCRGEDLAQYLKKYKTLTEKEAKQIMIQIFDGLKYLNEQPEKIIHYDLKPQNILLNQGEVKITDFGLSKIMEPNKTNMELTSQGVGTYWYQAPECFELGTPRISSKVDVWSAGIIFYEMLYAKKPFGHNMPQERLMKEQIILNAPGATFPNRPVVSSKCKDFIAECLEHDQDLRIDVISAANSPYFQNK